MWTTMMMLLMLLMLIGLSTASHVVVLDTSNFEHLTQASTGATTGDWMIKFYAPWCGHCKKLTPIWEELAEKLEGITNVAKIDVTQSRDLGQRFGIKGFPTLIFFSKGLIYKFKGPRTVDELYSFVTGGYKTYDSQKVPEEEGFFKSIVTSYASQVLKALDHLRQGRLSMEVLIGFGPLFIIMMFIFLVMMLTSMPAQPQKKKN